MVRIGNRCTQRRWLTCVVFAGSVSLTSLAHADGTVLSGAYTFSGSSNSQSCTPTGFDGPDNFNGSLNISGDPNGGFSGSGITSDSETTLTVSGTLFSNNSLTIVLEFQDVDGETGTLTGSGSFDGNSTVQFSASGSSNFCAIITVGVSLMKTSSSSLDPESTQLDSGSEVTQARALSTFVQGQPVAIGTRTRTALRNLRSGALAYNNGFMITGQAAGDGASSPMGAWLGYSRTSTKNRFATTTFSSERNDVLLGFDVSPRESLLLGVSLGLERSSTDTFFNRGEQDTTAITMAPYVGALLTDWLSVDASAGYSDVSTDQFRTVPGAMARVSSDVDSYRVFVNGNLSASHGFGNLLTSGQVGLLWARQHDDAFLESDGTSVGSQSSSIGRLLLGGELAYTAGAFEPYLHLMFQHDFSKTRQTFAPGVGAPKDDDNDLLLSLGLRYFGSNGVSASVQYSTLRGRRDLSESSLFGQVRWRY